MTHRGERIADRIDDLSSVRGTHRRRREPTSASCPLTFTWVSWHACPYPQLLNSLKGSEQSSGNAKRADDYINKASRVISRVNMAKERIHEFNSILLTKTGT